MRSLMIHGRSRENGQVHRNLGLAAYFLTNWANQLDCIQVSVTIDVED